MLNANGIMSRACNMATARRMLPAMVIPIRQGRLAQVQAVARSMGAHRAWIERAEGPKRPQPRVDPETDPAMFGVTTIASNLPSQKIPRRILRIVEVSGH